MVCVIAKGLTGRRFFARVVAAELACPKCGKVARIKKDQAGWEPRLSRWRCQGCGTQYVVGLLFWPARESRKGWQGGKGTSVPQDAVPGAQEAQELAKMKAEERPKAFRGLEVPAKRLVGGQVNVAIEEGEEE